MVVSDVLKEMSKRLELAHTRVMNMAQTSIDPAVRAAFFEFKTLKSMQDKILEQLKKEAL